MFTVFPVFSSFSPKNDHFSTWPRLVKAVAACKFQFSCHHLFSISTMNQPNLSVKTNSSQSLSDLNSIKTPGQSDLSFKSSIAICNNIGEPIKNPSDTPSSQHDSTKFNSLIESGNSKSSSPSPHDNINVSNLGTPAIHVDEPFRSTIEEEIDLGIQSNLPSSTNNSAIKRNSLRKRGEK